MTFPSRAAAGRALAERLAGEADLTAPLAVLAVDEASVAVAEVVAAALAAPFGRYATGRLVVPFRPALPCGAVTDDNHHYVDAVIAADHALTARDIAAQAKALLPQLRRQRGARPDLAGRAVVIVQDGLTWGHQALAVLASARAAGASSALIATPVAALDVAGTLAERDVPLVALRHEDGPRFHVPDFYAG